MCSYLWQPSTLKRLRQVLQITLSLQIKTEAGTPKSGPRTPKTWKWLKALSHSARRPPPNLQSCNRSRNSQSPSISTANMHAAWLLTLCPCAEVGELHDSQYSSSAVLAVCAEPDIHVHVYGLRHAGGWMDERMDGLMDGLMDSYTDSAHR